MVPFGANDPAADIVKLEPMFDLGRDFDISGSRGFRRPRVVGSTGTRVSPFRLEARRRWRTGGGSSPPRPPAPAIPDLALTDDEARKRPLERGVDVRKCFFPCRPATFGLRGFPTLWLAWLAAPFFDPATLEEMKTAKLPAGNFRCPAFPGQGGQGRRPFSKRNRGHVLQPEWGGLSFPDKAGGISRFPVDRAPGQGEFVAPGRALPFYSPAAFVRLTWNRSRLR